MTAYTSIDRLVDGALRRSENVAHLGFTRFLETTQATTLAPFCLGRTAAR